MQFHLFQASDITRTTCLFTLLIFRHDRGWILIHFLLSGLFLFTVPFHIVPDEKWVNFEHNVESSAEVLGLHYLISTLGWAFACVSSSPPSPPTHTHPHPENSKDFSSSLIQHNNIRLWDMCCLMICITEESQPDLIGDLTNAKTMECLHITGINWTHTWPASNKAS